MDLKRVIFFIAGLGVGFFLSHSQKKAPVVANEKEVIKNEVQVLKKNSGYSLNKIKKKLGVQDKIQVKGSGQNQYYKPEGKKKDVANVLREISQMDHFPAGGKPNIEIINLYEDVLKIEPNNLKALSGYSNYLIMFREFSSAKEVLFRCLAVNPQDKQCLKNSSLSQLYDDNDELAQRIDTCLKYIPKEVQCLNGKVQQLINKDELKTALKYAFKLEEANKVSEVRLSDALVNLNIGMIYDKIGNRKKAIKYLERSCQNGQKYACRRAETLTSN